MSMDFSHPNARPFALTAGENVVLLIHGFTGTPSHMRTIGEAAQAAGFSAHGILLPGHGLSLQEMEKTSGLDWLNAARAAMTEMRQKYRRVAVGGLSMGGILAILLASEFETSALLLFAPAMRYRQRINYLSPAAKYFLRTSKWKPPAFPAEDFLSDYDFGYPGAPVRKVEDMTSLQRMALKRLGGITCPTAIFQSHKDESVHVCVPERIARRISSDVKEIHWVDRSPHVLTIGPERQYINERVVDFLQRYGV